MDDIEKQVELTSRDTLLLHFRDIYQRIQDRGGLEVLSWNSVRFGIRYLKIWQSLLLGCICAEEVAQQFTNAELIEYFEMQSHLKQVFGKQLKRRDVRALRVVYRDLQFCTSFDCLRTKYPKLHEEYVLHTVNSNRRAILQHVENVVTYILAHTRTYDKTLYQELIKRLGHIFLKASEIDTDHIDTFVTLLETIEVGSTTSHFPLD